MVIEQGKNLVKSIMYLTWSSCRMWHKVLCSYNGIQFGENHELYCEFSFISLSRFELHCEFACISLLRLNYILYQHLEQGLELLNKVFA